MTFQKKKFFTSHWEKPDAETFEKFQISSIALEKKNLFYTTAAFSPWKEKTVLSREILFTTFLGEWRGLGGGGGEQRQLQSASSL